MHNNKLKKPGMNPLTSSNTGRAEAAINISEINTVKQSRAITEAKMKLAETHEIPVEWEQNIEKVKTEFKLCRYQVFLNIKMQESQALLKTLNKSKKILKQKSKMC